MNKQIFYTFFLITAFFYNSNFPMDINKTLDLNDNNANRTVTALFPYNIWSKSKIFECDAYDCFIISLLNNPMSDCSDCSFSTKEQIQDVQKESQFTVNNLHIYNKEIRERYKGIQMCNTSEIITDEVLIKQIQILLKIQSYSNEGKRIPYTLTIEKTDEGHSLYKKETSAGCLIKTKIASLSSDTLGKYANSAWMEFDLYPGGPIEICVSHETK